MNVNNIYDSIKDLLEVNAISEKYNRDVLAGTKYRVLGDIAIVYFINAGLSKVINGNIATIENAFMRVSKDLRYEYSPKFNFPTSEYFAALLRKNGFVIDKIYDYDRPTPLKDNEKGLANWMKQFFASDLELMTEKMQTEVIKNVEDLTRKSLWNGSQWIADYRRLRVIAHI